MKIAILFLLCLLPANLWAGEVDVGDVLVEKSAPGFYRFSVTVRHADTGWKHYADKWDIVGPGGEVFGTRALLHPHVGEQPFTRNLADIEISSEHDTVTVRAHDSVHRYGGRGVTVELPR